VAETSFRQTGLNRPWQKLNSGEDPAAECRLLEA